MPGHILRNRRLRDRQAQLQQLAVDSRCTPERIAAAHPLNEIPYFRPNRGPTPPASTLPCPVAPEALTVPPHHGLGAGPPAENSASSSTASTARPRRSGPSSSALGAAGAPSTRRVAALARGSPAPTPAACESWTAVSERGSQAISPYPVNNGSVSPTARQSRRTSSQEGQAGSLAERRGTHQQAP